MGASKQEQPERPTYPRRPVSENDQAVYVRAIRSHLRNGNRKYAYRIVRHAVARFPDNALILSYYGYLQAGLDRKYRRGIDACHEALAVFRPANAFCAELAYPILHLNLGRAYLAAGKRKEAIEAFETGLRYDSRHPELLIEQQGIGVRKRNPMPFLSRSHPINRYIGIMLRNSER